MGTLLLRIISACFSFKPLPNRSQNLNNELAPLSMLEFRRRTTQNKIKRDAKQINFYCKKLR